MRVATADFFLSVGADLRSRSEIFARAQPLKRAVLLPGRLRRCARCGAARTSRRVLRWTACDKGRGYLSGKSGAVGAVGRNGGLSLGRSGRFARAGGAGTAANCYLHVTKHRFVTCCVRHSQQREKAAGFSCGVRESARSGSGKRRSAASVSAMVSHGVARAARDASRRA